MIKFQVKKTIIKLENLKNLVENKLMDQLNKF